MKKFVGKYIVTHIHKNEYKYDPDTFDWEGTWMAEEGPLSEDYDEN